MADLAQLRLAVDARPDADPGIGLGLRRKAGRDARMMGGVERPIALEADVEAFLARQRLREIRRLAQLGEEAPGLVEAVARDERRRCPSWSADR